MKYYLKHSLFAFIYLIFMMAIALGILCIGISWLEIVLCILNLALYGLVIGVTFFKEGEASYRTLHANDVERMNIIRTGEDRPLKLHEEYKPWKGFVMGLTVSFPLLVCLLIHLILALSTNGTANGAGAVAGFVYMAFYAPLSVFIEKATCWTYFSLLYCIPVLMAMCGFPYMLGARKVRLQYEKINEQQRQIYGKSK